MEAVFNDNMTLAYSPRMTAVVRLDKTQQPTTPVVAPGFGTGSPHIEDWGDDNLFPQNVINECSRNTIIPATLDWKSRALYQQGIEYGIEELDSEGGVKFRRIMDTRVEMFLNRSRVSRYALEAAKDFYWFYNVFPELILSKDRKQILGLTCQEAAYCRWQKQDKKTGLVNGCYINANWDNGANIESVETSYIPVIDPYYDPVGALQNDSRGYKYIYPVSYPSPGKSFYQLADWNALRESGWLDVAQSVPAFKKALFQNQVTIKYMIEVATWWWEWKYPGFNQKPADQRQKIMSDELTAFEEFMTGTSKSGNSMMTTFKSDPERGKEYKGWVVTPVDNKIKDGVYIEDSQEASSHLLYALGVDPTLIGSAPGKGMGAGSGSDKQAAFNTYLSLVQVHADLILEPLHFIRDYNGWNPEIKFRFKREILMPQTSGKPRLTSTDQNAA